MANDPVLGMLGLARRAGKLAPGDEMTREACDNHKARAVFLAADAGAAAAKKAAFYAETANVPLIRLPHSKAELGGAIGKNQSAICALTDIGMAAAAVKKLAAMDESYAETAETLGAKDARIKSRKGKKKNKTDLPGGKPAGQDGADKKSQPKITTEVSANGN